MIQTNISNSRRSFIKSIVAEACVRFNKPKLPLEIKSLARSYPNIRLISYSKHIKRTNDSYDRLISIAKDAYTDYYAYSDMYYIYYNDIDYYIMHSDRYRWNIAHELGHVLLRHMSENDKTRILRSNLSNKEYRILEEEADYFAQLILVPHAAIAGFKITHHNHIRYLCKISEPAARRRFREYQAWFSHINGNDEYDQKIFHYYFDFIYKRSCKVCGSSLIQRYGKHCPICGSKNTLEWGDGKMIYDKFDSHNGKVKICPVCQNEETEIEGDYCQICGTSLRNKCANYPCDNNDTLPTNARFCPVCGGNSTFFNAGILKAWNHYADSLIDIPDEDIDYGSVSMEGLPF